jgi:pilus assembly protein CpaD
MCNIKSPVAERRVAVALGVVALAGTLAACSSTQPMTAQQVTASVPTDYRNRHPIVLREGPRTVELFIGNKRGTLTTAQRADVLAFAGEWRREATGGILVDLPSGTSNAGAAASALQEVRSILSAAGVPPQAVGVRPHRPSDPNKLVTLRLNYPKVQADAGPCGLWPQDIGPSWTRDHSENGEYWNLGCASQRNLAAMVANPADLVQPRGETPPYNGRRTTTLDKYHRGESTATTYSNTERGKISEIGQ